METISPGDAYNRIMTNRTISTKEYMERLALQSIAVIIPTQCVLCPYMVDYQCRAEKCYREK